MVTLMLIHSSWSAAEPSQAASYRWARASADWELLGTAMVVYPSLLRDVLC